ncbi:MAG TPA: Stp1/IreP family PP2C-type Ser/Thr phosphatase [Gaiellaceae bacterium]|nr:Stp1/IreP family PP2C-type Ser/Thr phosphatase [Gaiellaceae bacterium]
MTLGRSASVTDPGRRRRRNEDSYVCEPPLFAIADGMGGAQAGEVASRLAAAVLQEANGAELSETLIAELIQEANRRVFQRSSEDAATSGMGTTMTVALVDDPGESIVVGHVGDSRAYRVRGGELEQLTEDHSLVGELLRSGRLSAEEAEIHPQRSVITRAIGTEPDVDVDTFTIPARPGDLFLLCSDGLTDMIPDREILSILDGEDDLDAAARALVDAANSAGGEDNITVVLFQIAAAGEDTVRLPAAAASPQQEPELEDTLSGLEAVPAVDTAVVSAEDVREHIRREEAREDEARQPRRVLPLLLLVLLLGVVVALVVWGLYR